MGRLIHLLHCDTRFRELRIRTPPPNPVPVREWFLLAHVAKREFGATRSCVVGVEQEVGVDAVRRPCRASGAPMTGALGCVVGVFFGGLPRRLWYCGGISPAGCWRCC